MEQGILLLGGSHARPSRTGALLRAVELMLQRKGAEVEVWDLAERPLPLADPAYYSRPGEHPAATVRELAEAADLADGMVLASPLYHNSYSGALKNALDLLSTRQFEGKPVGLASNSGGAHGTQAVDHLRLVVRGLRGVAIPTQVVTLDGDYAPIDGGHRLANPSIEERLERFAEELLWFVARLRGNAERTRE